MAKNKNKTSEEEIKMNNSFYPTKKKQNVSYSITTRLILSKTCNIQIIKVNKTEREGRTKTKSYNSQVYQAKY